MKNLPHLVLAFDFGGTKMSAALVDVDHGAIYSRRRLHTPAQEGAEVCLQAMTGAGDTLLAELPVRNSVHAIGVSFGGPLEKNRRIVLNSHHVARWQGFPLPERLAGHFDLPAVMDNDGNAAALGEWRYGAGQTTRNMLYIQVSTGIGSGLILDRRLFRGEGLAGEFGHMTIAPDGPQCTCGKYGCLESLASGWAIARDGRRALPASSPGDPLRTVCGGDPTALDAGLVFEAHRQGSQAAGEVIYRMAGYLALGIANTACLLDPQYVVLGGGVMHSWDILAPLLTAALNIHLPPMFKEKISLVPSSLGGDETLIGAALLTLFD